MNYLHLTTQQQVSEQQIRLAFPNTSFATPFKAPDGYAVVFPAPQPTYDPIAQFVREIAPELTDKGHWEQRWEIVDLDAEQVAVNQANQLNQTKEAITKAVQQRLDDFAATRGYDNIVSACSYATSNHERYGSDGRYCVAIREATWDRVFDIQNVALTGMRAAPTGYAEIEAELPELVWPEVLQA